MDRSHTRAPWERATLASAVFAALLAGPSACGESAPERWEPWTLEVQAVVHGEPLVCGAQHSSVGVSDSGLAVSSLRLYVHDIHAIAEDGSEVYPALDIAPTQSPRGVVLVDLCAGEGAATAGARIMGLLPRGRYTAVHFEVGLPDRLADTSPLDAEPPLDLSGIWSANRADYLFLQLAATTDTGADVRFDLARAGCGLAVAADALRTREQPHTLGSNGAPTGATTRCAYPNRAPVTLEGFDPARSRLVFDVGALLSASDLESNAEGTAQGCTSAPSDLDCQGPFNGLGLPFGDQVGVPPQRVWSLKEAP